MRKLAPVAAAVTLAAGVTACSSAASSGSPASSAKTSTRSSAQAAAAQTSGTEKIYGKITGSAAMANNPVFHLTLTGPVATTATTSLGGTPKKGAAHTFSTGAGNLTVTLDSAGTNTGGLKSSQTCLYDFTTAVPFTVDGAKSTGRFAGAAGTGQAAVVFSGNLPKLRNGKCDESQNAEPSPKTAVGTFTATAALTVKH